MHLQPGTEVRSSQDVISGRYYAELINREVEFSFTETYPCINFDPSSATAYHQGKNCYYAFYKEENAIGWVSLAWGDVTIKVAGTQESAHKMLEDLRTKAPKEVQTDPNKIPVTFWSLGANGPWSIRRALDVPDWKDIQINYTKDTLEPLKEMLNPDFRPGRGGLLFLWHGEPGTGKTTAIRALAKEWVGWCDMHYIVDPERFFGQESAYMMQVLMGAGDEPDYLPGSVKPEERWRLLILEDCGELLTPDARAQSGQGLSRFLNAVDGLIGQGLRTIILVTTNEEAGKLHPAVQRPGRCGANINFDKLGEDEVVKWLKANKSSFKDAKPMPIADLYAYHEDRKKTKQTVVGFGA